jgi:DNA-3-methyladenine glycosylase II
LHITSGALRPAPPFDFGQSLAFLGAFAPTRADQTLTDRSLTKAVSLDGQTIVFRVASSGVVATPRLAYTLSSDQPITPAIERAAADRIGFFLSLDDDLRPFYALGAADPAFAPILRRLYGYHQVKFLTPFENACWAVLTQRTPQPVARRLKTALIERAGRRLTVDGIVHWAFPEPADLAGMPDAALTTLLGNERQAGYLSAAARAFAGADERWLRAGPYDEVEAWLRAIPGIGPWSAAFILIRGLGRMERLAGEPALLRAAARLYGLDEATADAAVARIAARYGEWQGYWAHYLRAGTGD